MYLWEGRERPRGGSLSSTQTSKRRDVKDVEVVRGAGGMQSKTAEAEGRLQNAGDREIRAVGGGAHRALAGAIDHTVGAPGTKNVVRVPPPETQVDAGRPSQIGTVSQLVAGGVAGAFSKTCTAPLARLTILFQVIQFVVSL
jgi:hypothetical protein